MASVPPKAWKESFGWNALKEESLAKYHILHVRKGLKSVYQNAEGWKEFGEILDDVDIFEYQGFKFRINLSTDEVSVTGMSDSSMSGVDTHAQSQENEFVKIPQTVEYDGSLYPVTKISNWAIDLSQSEEVELPETIKSIADFGIYRKYDGRYHESTSIKCYAVNPPEVHSAYAFPWQAFLSSYTLYVPVESKSLYENTPIWNQFQIKELELSGEPTIFEDDIDLTDKVVYYTLTGILLNNRPTTGFYIERHSNGQSVIKSAVNSQ